MLKPAFLKDDAFLAEVRKGLAGNARRLWWLGQSGFLIIHGGRALLLDPYLSDSLTRKYEHTDKPHTRMTECVIDPENLAALGVIDLITSSHNHTDHFDPDTLKPLLSANRSTRLVIPIANREPANERLPGFSERFVEIDAGQSLTLNGITISALSSAHPTVERDSAGHCRFLGYVIEWDGVTFYHSGDTLWHEGLEPALGQFAIDIALLPINGDRPERRVAGNLDGPQAARLAKSIEARLVIPCHFDLFEFNTASPEAFVLECKRIGQAFTVLRHGEGWDVSDQ